MSLISTQGFGGNTAINPSGYRVGGGLGAIPKLTQALGVDRQFEIDLYDGGGLPIPSGVFLGTEPITATLWTGGSNPGQSLPIVAWLTPSPIPPAPASIVLTVRSTDTELLVPGTYRVQVTCVSGLGLITMLWDGSLEITGAPGSAIATPVYCQYSDMRKYASWLADLNDPRRMQTDFLEARGEARTWLDGILMKNYRSLSMIPFGNMTNGMLNGMWAPLQSIGYYPWVVQQLAANTLMLYPEVVKCVSHHAIGIVCQSQLGAGGRSDYARFADRYFTIARNYILNASFQLDINGDGNPDVVITVGTGNVLWG